jgi:prepilin-type N-terminal cleavage/methylation domain-containing protein/prepilin-type processing-associated H-X9-DG protein
MDNVAMRQNHGFTLVELLVVVAIIGILLSLTVAGLQSVRRRALVAACASNLRQIGMANLSYMQDNNWEIVPGNTGNPNLNWYHYLRPYTIRKEISRERYGRKVQLFICPADPTHGGSDRYLADDCRSYAVNVDFLNFSREYGHRPMFTDVEVPSSTILAGDANVAEFNSNWIGPEDAHFVKLPEDRHGGKINLVMLDGHIETVQRMELAMDGVNESYWWVEKDRTADE